MSTYLAALIGAILLIIVWLKQEKDKHDKNPRYKKSWSKFLSQKWDDFLLAIITGLALCSVQESMFFFIVRFMDYDYQKATDLYFDSEEFIAFGLGLFGTLLFKLGYGYVQNKLNKLSE